MRDCVKLKTCLPSSSFCLAVLYSLGVATRPCCCACAVAPGSATARNQKASMDGDLMFDVPPRDLVDNQEKYIVNIRKRQALVNILVAAAPIGSSIGWDFSKMPCSLWFANDPSGSTSYDEHPRRVCPRRDRSPHRNPRFTRAPLFH